MSFRPGDWKCSCQKINFSARKVCFGCGQPKETVGFVRAALVTFRPGDWYCVHCQDHQFAKNTVCRRCQAAKPIQSGDCTGLECAICLTNVKNRGFLHGDDVHVVCCSECASQCSVTCPLCRQRIEKIVNIYL